MNSEKSYTSIATYQAAIIQSQAFRALNNFTTAHLRAFNLSLSEWKILGYLCEVSVVTPSQICKVMGVKTPIGSRLLKSLEKKKLIKRRRNPIDNRIVEVNIAAKGKQLAAEIERPLRAEMKAFLNDVPRQQLAVYLSVISKIAAKME